MLIVIFYQAQKSGTLVPIFGEALAFYEVISTNQWLVVYHPLCNVQKVLNRWRGTWSHDIEVLEVSEIQGLIGIWGFNSRIWVIRKHPGLSLLSQEEYGIQTAETEKDE
jgi:hypothetical protein